MIKPEIIEVPSVGDTIVVFNENQYWDGLEGVLLSLPSDPRYLGANTEKGGYTPDIAHYAYVKITKEVPINAKNYSNGDIVGVAHNHIKTIPSPKQAPYCSLRRFSLNLTIEEEK